MSSRNRQFPHPLHPSVTVVQNSEGGTFSFLKPTHADLKHHNDGTVAWKARDHRKGRLNFLNHPQAQKMQQRSVWRKIARIATDVQYWNISWWVAMGYTMGSVVWVINGFVEFLPFCTSMNKNPVSGGWSAWLGATIFEFASWLLIWEAWNRGDDADFGWGLQRALAGKPLTTEKSGPEGRYTNFEDVERQDDQPTENGENSGNHHPRKWIWFTTDTKYWSELGFLAGVVQLFAATVFWISGFTGLPVIQNAIQTNIPLLNGVFWTTQVIGGTGFMISSILYMLEAQKKWYKPEPLELGWHIGFWNLVGGTGFMLCGAFGYSTAHWAEYESSLSTFWGGWAFLIGSGIQWYEVVNPVTATEPDRNGDGDGRQSQGNGQSTQEAPEDGKQLQGNEKPTLGGGQVNGDSQGQ